MGHDRLGNVGDAQAIVAIYDNDLAASDQLAIQEELYRIVHLTIQLDD